MRHIHDYVDSVSSIHVRIGITSLINTTVGLLVALFRYKWIHTGHVGTHPIENFFGYLRLVSNYNHSVINIIRALGKTAYIREMLNELNLSYTARTRLEIGGVIVYDICKDGVLPDVFPIHDF